MTALQALIKRDDGGPVLVQVASVDVLEAFADALDKPVTVVGGRHHVAADVAGVPAVFWADA